MILDARYLQTILESIPVGVCLTDADGIFTYVNPTYCQMYGYTSAELIGKHFTLVVPSDQRESLGEIHDRFMQGSEELRGEWTVRRKDGSTFSILADAAYIPDNGFGPQKATFVMDISDRKQVECELAQAVEQLHIEIEERRELERIRDDVERIVRHDLRNPLNAILIATQLLLSSDLSEQQKSLVNMAQESGHKLNYMISNSLDFALMERGGYSLHPRRLRLIDMVRTVMHEATPVREQHKVSVRLMYNGQKMSGEMPLMIEGERIHLENLFSNVLRNAIEASSEGAEVEFAVQDQEDSILISFHNDSLVPEEIRDRFFDRYVTSGKEDGTGLGTYIASLITRIHGGKIDFRSTEQEGTWVNIVLPKEQKSAGSSQTVAGEKT